jgi:hypothetical protein
MEANRTSNSSKPIEVTLGAQEYTVAPGKNIEISVLITNRGQEGDYFITSLLDIPPEWVADSAQRSVWIAAQAQGKVVLDVRPPVGGEGVTDTHHARVYVFGQKAPESGINLEFLIKVMPGETGHAAFESGGRIGVKMSSVQFSTAPGGSLTIPVTLHNRGLQNDNFRLGAEGIPVNWVSTSTPVNPLAAGESREILLVVRPPLSPSSQAGRQKFTLTVSSQNSPAEVVRVECVLTLAAYTQFTATLEPEEARAGEMVSVRVKNEGNIQQVFHLTCLSENDRLAFEFLTPELAPQAAPAVSPTSPTQASAAAPTAGPSGSKPAGQVSGSGVGQPEDYTTLPIPAGETAAFRFIPKPHKRPLFGGTVAFAYHAAVKSDQREAPLLPGRVISRGMIPLRR